MGAEGWVILELALRIPERIGSLVLAVTTPGGPIWNNIPPWKGVASLAKLMFTPDPVKNAPIVMSMLYPDKWLEAENERNPGKTNREVQIDVSKIC
jgi:pimeloyl-ACP methyl ester carboxylesterase